MRRQEWRGFSATDKCSLLLHPAEEAETAETCQAAPTSSWSDFMTQHRVGLPANLPQGHSQLLTLPLPFASFILRLIRVHMRLLLI